MLVLALNPGHDGAAALIKDRRLLVSLEAEKDSFRRHDRLSIPSLLAAAGAVDEPPDAIAVGGWVKFGALGTPEFGAGYMGGLVVERGEGRFFGRSVKTFSSSHIRSHIMSGIGMSPRDDATRRAVLVWEGFVGSFYLVDEGFDVTDEIPVLSHPGNRYAFLFGLADPAFPDRGMTTRMPDSGKLMALAAYGDASEATDEIRETIDRILSFPSIVIAPKHAFHDSPVYNAGVESDACKIAAALLTERIFEMFADVAQAVIPPGIPLHVSGGCGLNCDWNFAWRQLGHFSSVFVAPCPNDAGSAIGHGIDALHAITGDPYIDWDVYCGLEFDWDQAPDPARWRRRDFDEVEVARALADGQVLGWVQGRWEIGPRALGNRSILAAPFDPAMRQRLNQIKQREDYRPIAPCCRVEDLGLVFNETFEDPYMLYFRTVKSDRFGAITHVDGSARCQTVTEQANAPLHRLLTACAGVSGVGLLCNTSLNFSGRGFINRMSDLTKYCEWRGLDAFVVGDAWFEQTAA